MKTQQKLLGFFSGAVLFLTFLYLYPVQSQAPSSQQNLPKTVSAQEERPVGKEIDFKSIGQGDTAPGAKNRKNYAIYNQEELNSFWKLSHEVDTEKAPTIDFTKGYVIVVFAGTKPTLGYDIKITQVKDVGVSRNIEVLITEPGEGCTIIDEKTSPFQFVRVPFGNESSLSHTDVTKKKDC